MSDSKESFEEPTQDKIEFKLPVLIGRIGKLPKKIKFGVESQSESTSQGTIIEKPSESVLKNYLPPAVGLKELSTPIPYKEPKWSGKCPEGAEYGLEVLKSGMIVEQIDLTNKPYYVFGRLSNSDVILGHPTISRYHAVLQYKAFAQDGEPPSGWYIFDLGSTHGTFLNRERLREDQYFRVRVGHQIKFGSSTRTYIVLGPNFDSEGESDLSVTEIKKRAANMKLERDRMIKEEMEQRERNRLEEERRREEQGIDWGLGDDAEDEQDLADNPYATTANEELYLDDPKKTLRGYFEREGYDLVYDCEERGVGQFLCRVELPLEDGAGRTLQAEALHRGRKRDAVAACALEACRLLDRAGLLRRATHESRRRKQRDWSADDYYDSDEDTFLDRTGSVEKKRRARMEKHGAVEQEASKPLTYDDLLKKIADIEKKISTEEKALDCLRSTKKPKKEVKEDEDALDEFMNTLGKQGQSMAEKAEISKTKMSVQKLKTELAKTQRLAELARPAHVPPLVKKDDSKMAVKQTNSVIYGKRLRLKDDIEKRPKVQRETKQEEEFVEEMDSDDETEPLQQELSTAKDIKSEDDVKETNKEENTKTEKKIYGPMRPPENYVVPEDYFNQETDRDLPEIEEKDT